MKPIFVIFLLTLNISFMECGNETGKTEKSLGHEHKSENVQEKMSGILPEGTQKESQGKNELLIKILWAPFDETFKLSPQQNWSLGGSRFQLSVSNLDGTIEHKLGGTDHADMLHLSGEKMQNFIANFVKRKEESSQAAAEGQSSKRPIAKRKLKSKNHDMQLHIKFKTKDGRQMDFTKTMQYSSGKKILLCALPENKKSCQLMDWTAQNQAALLQRHYKFHFTTESELLGEAGATLLQIRCIEGQQQEQENGGTLNAAFVAGTNRIEFAKGKMCKNNEYELAYSRTDKNGIRQEMTSIVNCDEAIYDLNRINEFQLIQKDDNKGKRAHGDMHLDFECKLLGGEVLDSVEELAARMSGMSKAESAYQQWLNDIEKDEKEMEENETEVKETEKTPKHDQIHQKVLFDLIAKSNSNKKRKRGEKGKAEAAASKRTKMQAKDTTMVLPHHKMQATKTVQNKGEIGKKPKTVSVYHANVSSTSSNTSSSSNVDVEILKKLMAEKAYLQEVTERKDAEIEQIYEDNADTITELERLKEAKKDVPRDYKELDFLHRQNGVMQVQLTEDSELIAEHRKMMETLFAKFGQIKGAMKENSPNPATEKQEENNHTKKLTATINQILAEVHSLSVDFQSMPNRVTVVGNQIQQRQPKQQQPKQHAVAGTASAAAGWMEGHHDQQGIGLADLEQLLHGTAETALPPSHYLHAPEATMTQAQYDAELQRIIEDSKKINEAEEQKRAIEAAAAAALDIGKTGKNDDEAGSSHVAMKEEEEEKGRADPILEHHPQQMDIDAIHEEAPIQQQQPHQVEPVEIQSTDKIPKKEEEEPTVEQQQKKSHSSSSSK